MEFITKDSWVRKEFSNWFVRDTDEWKLRFDLIPIEALERLAGTYTRWAKKYWDNNRTLAEWEEAISRFKQSAFRHFISRMKWNYEEDHWYACIFNIIAYEYLTNKL